jgi:hypothetical protein
MNRRMWNSAIALGLLLIFSAGIVASAKEKAEEKAAVAQVIDQSFSWFKTKDFDLLFQIMSDSPSLFLFQPTSTTTIIGGDAFKKYSVGWKNPDLAYDHHELRDLRIDLSPHRDVAWFSTLADDCSRYKGKTGCWKDTRVTGVLLKQKGRWVIVQMHFSFAADKIIAEEKAKQEAKTP